MSESLNIHLFGPFEISLDGTPLNNHNWGSQQTQTIAKILFSNAGKVITSDFLMEILWPNDPEKITRGRLHVRISQLRNSLKAKKELLRTVHGGYIFEVDNSCWLDVLEFQSLLSQGKGFQENDQQLRAIQMYEEARQLYRGDFLAEDLFSDWTYTKREYYRERFLTLLIELSESYAQQGRFRLAIARARQALNEDPLRETIYARLMMYYYYAGDRAQSLNIYEDCCVILEKELNVAPMESTVQLADQIRGGILWKDAQTTRYPPPIYEGRLFEVPYSLSEIPFVGRDKEYAWLVSHWKDPKNHVILLEGEAGIGKSRLLEAFTGFVASRGVRVLQAHISMADHTPLTVTSHVLRELLTNRALEKLSPETISVLATLFPELTKRFNKLPDLPNLAPDAARQRLIQSITDLAKANSSEITTIVVDDAHRLNLEAVDLLQHLSQFFKMIISYRGEDTPSDHPLRNSFGNNALKLKPIADSAIESIIQQLSGQENKTIASQIITQSSGNPLFAVTLLQHMFENGQLFVDAKGEWKMTDQFSTSLPETLRNTIERRIQHLNRAERHVLDYAVVIGGEFDFELLKMSLKQSEENLLANLDALIDSNLILEPRSKNMPEFMISHDRYTEVAYETIPSVRRRIMHLDVARAIEKVYAGRLNQHFAALADHFDRAGNANDAAHYAALAGEQAVEKFAVSEALHYLGRAIALLPSNEIAKQAQLRLNREKVYSLQGMRDMQQEELTKLEALSAQLPTIVQAEICLRQAAYEWIMGNYQDEMDAVNCAILKAKSCKAIDLEARAYYLIGISDDDMDKRIQYLNLAQKLAHEINHLALEGDALRWLGNTAYWQNQYARSMEYLSQALSMHREVGDLRGELSALNNLGHVHKTLGELQLAAQYYQQALEICQKISDKLAEGVILTNLGGLALDLGEFERSKSALSRAAEIRAEIGNEEGLAMAENQMGDLFRQSGRYDKSLAHYQNALAINTRIDHEKQICESLNGLGALYRDLGDFDRSQASLDQSLARNTDKKSPRHIQALIEMSLLNFYASDPETAVSMAKEALTLSKKLPAYQAAAHKNIGHILLSLGQLNNARSHFEDAVSIYQQLGQVHLGVEPTAGLAAIAISNQDLDQAIKFVKDIMARFQDTPLYGPDRTLWIYLTVYQILNQINDPRSHNVINKAQTLLDQRRLTIKDKSLQKSYLEKIPENKQIAEIWGKDKKND